MDINMKIHYQRLLQISKVILRGKSIKLFMQILLGNFKTGQAK